MNDGHYIQLIAIDPGRSKCGFAYYSGGKLVERGIATTEELLLRIGQMDYSLLVIGDRTGAESFLNQLFPEDVHGDAKVFLVDENLSSQEGRWRYLRHNRTGWRRFWPLGLQSPGQAYDDFVAEIIAERFLRKTHTIREWRRK
jgi:RNase H-fold protein (predicted Holliday junction resolvase)